MYNIDIIYNNIYREREFLSTVVQSQDKQKSTFPIPINTSQ